jgi:hypothetical protein
MTIAGRSRFPRPSSDGGLFSGTSSSGFAGRIGLACPGRRARACWAHTHAGQGAGVAAYEPGAVRARIRGAIGGAADCRGSGCLAGVRRDHRMGGATVAWRQLVRRHVVRRGGPGHARADGQLHSSAAGHRDQRGAASALRHRPTPRAADDGSGLRPAVRDPARPFRCPFARAGGHGRVRRPGQPQRACSASGSESG